MRSVFKARKAGTFRGDKAIAAACAEPAAPAIPTPSRAPCAIEPAAPMKVEAEQKPRGMKRLHGKTKS